MYSAKFILILPFIQSAIGHKCYVCGPDNEKPEDILQLKRNFPDRKIPLCSGYKSSLQQEYLIDCPAGSNGCLTKFEDDGSVMRTCAKIGIDDCKEANSVNYCYCSKEGCNTPERLLSPSVGWRPDDHIQPRPRQGHEIDFSAPRIQHPPIDDEDSVGGVEGSGDEDDWGNFYYDSYYDTMYDKNTVWHYDTGFADFEGFDSDTEPDSPDEGEITEPPPFIQQEIEAEIIVPVHKFDRGGESENEIVFVEETGTVRPASSATQLQATLILCLVSLLKYVLS